MKNLLFFLTLTLLSAITTHLYFTKVLEYKVVPGLVTDKPLIKTETIPVEFLGFDEDHLPVYRSGLQKTNFALKLKLPGNQGEIVLPVDREYQRTIDTQVYAPVLETRNRITGTVTRSVKHTVIK